MSTLTLYCREEDKPAIAQARKLLAFHEDKTLDQLLMEQVREVIAKYGHAGGGEDNPVMPIRPEQPDQVGRWVMSKQVAALTKDSE